jgi:chromosome segregation ATPase
MSEVEKKLEGVLTEYAKMDDALKDMYVRLRELDSISESYNKTKSSLESSSGNLRATSEALIAEIEILKDLASKLGKSQIMTFNDKLDSLVSALMKLQLSLHKSRLMSLYTLGLVAVALIVALYAILR